MKKTLIAAALLLIAGAASAQAKSADDKFYGELGLHLTDLHVDGVSTSPNLNAGTALFGYQFHPNFSGEVFLTTGLSKANYGAGIEVGLDNGIGVNLRPSYKFTDKFEAFARLGYVHYKLSLHTPFGSGTSSESSVLYGVGANYYFTDKVYGQLSYTSFFDKDGVSVRGFGASVGYRF